MNELTSILQTIKKLLGIPADYDHFDSDIIIHINSAFSVLAQLGVGPKEGFSISDDSAKWDDFVPDENQLLQNVKTYVYLKVRIVFDPPLSSAVLECQKEQIKEMEWRLQVASENLTEQEENQNG